MPAWWDCSSPFTSSEDCVFRHQLDMAISVGDKLSHQMCVTLNFRKPTLIDSFDFDGWGQSRWRLSARDLAPDSFGNLTWYQLSLITNWLICFSPTVRRYGEAKREACRFKLSCGSRSSSLAMRWGVIGRATPSFAGGFERSTRHPSCLKGRRGREGGEALVLN